MSSQFTAEQLVVLPHEGKERGAMLVKLGTEDLGGAFSIMQSVIEPRTLLSPHMHYDEDQAVFIISGELEFEVGGKGGLRFAAPAGSYVRKPREIVHGFWNAGDVPAHYIELNAGKLFEEFVDAQADNIVRAAITAEKNYRIKFDFESIPRLMKEHKLTKVAGLDGIEVPQWLVELLDC